MGGLLTRSSAVQGDGKVRKEKRNRRHQPLQVPFEPDFYLLPDENDNEGSNIDFIHPFEAWKPSSMINTNDPPGAPSTYSTTPSDFNWSSPLDSDHSYYPIDRLQMIPSYHLPYISHQGQIPDTLTAVKSDERPLKKVQFSSSNQPQQKQQTAAFKPLTSTQSWHESNDISTQSSTKPVPLSARSSLPRTTVSMPKISAARAPVEKPIYIGVDFRATLAERSQIRDNKRHRRAAEKPHSEGLNSSSNHHRARSQPTHQDKRQTLTDSPQSNTETSLPKSFNNKLVQNNEQSNDIKPVKARPHHHHRHQQQQSSMNNDVKPLKTHRRNHHQQVSSPARIQPATRPIQSEQPSAPVMRIPLSQLKRQPIVLSSTTKNHRTLL